MSRGRCRCAVTARCMHCEQPGGMRKAGKRVRLLSLLLLMLAGLGATIGLAGCVNNSQAHGPQTYTITVTGTAGNLSNSTTVLLTVD